MSDKEGDETDTLTPLAPAIEETLAPMAPTTGEKPRGRPFEPGVSGNPRGRPKGSRNQRTVFFEGMLDHRAEEMLHTLFDLALNRDPMAMRFCAERILPLRRDRRVEFDLPEIATTDDGVKASAAIMHAFAAGELSPNEATTAMRLLQAHLGVLEQAKLEPRVSALEEKLRE